MLVWTGAPACPHDAERDSAGQCACIEGTFPLLGACVPASVGDAYCGPAARIERDGCTFRACSVNDALDRTTGRCVPLPADGRAREVSCASPSLPIMEGGHFVCALASASCPRGTARAGARCVRPPRCPPGSLFDGRGCRPFVFGSDRGLPRVDVAAFLALAIGIDGGAGTANLCAPIDDGQAPSAARVDDGAAGQSPRPPDGSKRSKPSAGVRVHVAITVPDQDLTRLSVDATAARPIGTAGLPGVIGTGLESAVTDSARTLLEPLRGVGGEASVAAASVDVACGEEPAGAR
jgi:hypothetical protein